MPDERTVTVVHVESEAWQNALFDNTAVYAGRQTSKQIDIGWGNPFVIGRDGKRDDVIAQYERYLLSSLELLRRIKMLPQTVVLGCYCKARYPGEPNSPCHADIIARYARLSDKQIDRLIALNEKIINFVDKADGA